VSDKGLSKQSQRIQEWLLLILRFAITQEKVDRAPVLAAAEAMDRLSAMNGGRGFSFFVRSSREICDLIAGKHGPGECAQLRLLLRRIDDARLKRALEAVLEMERPDLKVRRPRPRRPLDLWRGLPGRL
jgi:hypothetical protein